ncbi:MAG: hypothetical protein HKO05_03635 [Erythrobacter sp.]|nr:hypothetical protein [Erythrobacter sp.]
MAAIEGLNLVRDTPSEIASEETLWVELQRDGLTYDCSGLTPGPANAMPDITRWLGSQPEGSLIPGSHIGLGLGPHIRAGQALLPILRGLLKVAVDLAGSFEDCAGVCWLASRMAADPKSLESMIAGGNGTGPLPISWLMATHDTAEGHVVTEGLAYFSGQELRIRSGIAQDTSEAALLALRLANQVIHMGGLEGSERFTGPDGLVLTLEPSGDGGLIDVRRD